MSSRRLLDSTQARLSSGPGRRYPLTSSSVNLIGKGNVGVADEPSRAERLKDDPTLLDSAVEELLRHDSPLERAPERYAADVTISGVTIPRGGIVFEVDRPREPRRRTVPRPGCAGHHGRGLSRNHYGRKTLWSPYLKISSSSSTRISPASNSWRSFGSSRRTPSEEWDADELGRAVQAKPEVVASYIVIMHGRGLLTMTGERQSDVPLRPRPGTGGDRGAAAAILQRASCNHD